MVRMGREDRQMRNQCNSIKEFHRWTENLLRSSGESIFPTAFSYIVVIFRRLTVITLLFYLYAYFQNLGQ